MIFRKWDRTQPLCLGKFGIPEPHSNHVSLEPDILIVPLLAFDKNKIGLVMVVAIMTNIFMSLKNIVNWFRF